ncbi:MAG: histidinol-phosphatase [Lachnospiraceae bacterium]|nr:histidinol-phosphatase [Lachnospiraceae bacterium]
MNGLFNGIEGYPYLYETHMHSSESSACAVNTAVEMAKAHKAYGYTGMVMTNHNWGGNTAVDRHSSWHDFLDAFFAPYYLAKEWGDANDFCVLPGYEAGYHGTEFLIYGVDIEWMYDHPELREATVAEQFDIIHSGGGIVVHAHPFREASYISEIRLFPEYIDGVEAVNAAHVAPYVPKDNIKFNEKALKYARELGIFITGGSDSHSVDLVGGGMAFADRLRDIHDLAERLRNAGPDDYRVTDGVRIYDAYGGQL